MNPHSFCGLLMLPPSSVKKVPHRREHRLKVGMTRGDKKNFTHKDKCGHNNPLSFFTVLFFDSFMQDAKRKKIAYLHRT